MCANKIAIIPDTNFFHNDEEEDLHLFKLNLNSYYNFLNAVNFRGYGDEIFMFIPEGVVCELIAHHKRDLKKVLDDNELEDKLKNINVNDVINLDLDAYCAELRNNYCNKLRLIKIPENKEKLFEVIFKRALDKVPPFKKNSDAGFKDTIIFLSLFNPQILDFNKIIFVSNDSGFTDKELELQKEFNEYWVNEINPPSLNVRTKREFFKWLDDEYGIFNKLVNYIEDAFFDKILDNYSRNSIILWSNDYLEIEDYDLIKEDTEIFYDEDERYSVTIYLSILINRSSDRVEGIFYEKNDEYKITQKETYIFEKKNNNWCYELINSRYEVLFDEWDESYMWDEYPTM